MAQVGLFDNYNSASFTSTLSGISGNVDGFRFRPQLDCLLIGMRWYRRDAVTGDEPDAMAVYRASDQVKVGEVTVITPSSGVGWHEWATTTTPLLGRGVEYRIAMHTGASTRLAFGAYGTEPVPPDALSWVEPARCFVSYATIIYPNNADTYGMLGIDIVVDDQNAAPPGTVGPNDLADWLSVSDNTHGTDSAPIATNTRTLSMEGVQNGIATQIGDFVAAGLTDAATAVGAIKTSVGAGLNTIASDAKTAAQAVSAFTASAFQKEADMFTGLYNATGWTPLQYGGKLATWLGSLFRATAVGGTGWTLVASTSFTDSKLWAQAADAYIVTFSDVGANDTATIAGGLDVVFRLAWWARSDAEGTDERHFIDFPNAVLTDGGKRMTGLLLNCPRGGAGTIDAYQFTG